MSERKLLGYADVDSGQLMVVDPCYVDEGFDYTALINQWPFDNVGEGRIYSVPVHKNYARGWVFETAWGDGSYPVYGEIENGRTVRVIIEMDSWESEEDE